MSERAEITCGDVGNDIPCIFWVDRQCYCLGEVISLYTTPDHPCRCPAERTGALIAQLSDDAKQRVVNEWLREHMLIDSELHKHGKWFYCSGEINNIADTPTAAVLGERDEEASDE